MTMPLARQPAGGGQPAEIGTDRMADPAGVAQLRMPGRG